MHGVGPGHIVTETLSGSLPWKSRPQLRKLIRRLKPGDSFTVAEIDHREQYQECVTQADYEFDCEGPNPEAEHEPDMTPGLG